MAQRARIVLLAAEGLPNAEIARRVGMTRPTVILWRNRYLAGGIRALGDLDRSGRPRVIDEAAVVVATLQPPAESLGVTHWSARLLVKELGVSFASVARIWRDWKLQPWRRETFKFSTGLAQGWSFVCLDGTLIASTRSSAPSPAGHDLWYSGKHKQHGGNIRVLTCPTGYPEWVSEVEPGSTHDITAAREHALGALYPAAARGLPTLADKGYAGAGMGIIVPSKGHHLAPDNQARDTLISALRAPAERANVLLKRTWKALERVTLDPWRIGAITAAALVPLHLQRPTR